MKSPIRRALLISISLHLIALIVTFYIVVSEPAEEPVTDKLFVDFFNAPKTRASMPKIEVEPTQALPRQVKKSARIVPPRNDFYQPVAVQPRRMEAITANQSPDSSGLSNRNQLDAAHIAPPQAVGDEIRTAVRELSVNQPLLPQTEATTTSGTSTRGLGRPDSSGLRNPRADSRSLHQVLESEVNGDAVMPNVDLFDTGNPSLPQIGLDQVMKNIARKIVDSSEGGPIDVVFVVDASGSMGDNIRGVAEHLIEMLDVYKSSGIDYALGLTEFWAPRQPPHNMIRVLQLTKNMREYRGELMRIQPRRDENALDAIEQTVREMRFRPTSVKHLIVVTDEPFTSLKGLTLDQVIALCREFGIHVNVLGLPSDEHRSLATETDGHWHAIPQNRNRQPRVSNPTRRGRQRYTARALRNATWSGAAEISQVSLEALPNNALDIILFVDTSLSMADKLPQFLQQFETMVRDWDNALVDYQIGVVRFRTGTGAFNYVNVFQPPQTIDQIHKIVNLPCQGNEQLLDAIVEGMRKIHLRPKALPYLIIITDEPSTGGHSPQAVIQLCLEIGAKVSVIGTFDSFQQEVAMKTNGVWVPIPDGKRTNSPNW